MLCSRSVVDIRDFIGLLKHSRGDFAGQPFVLERWQSEYLDKLFNTKRPDGLRQYRTSLLALPRKNGKALAIDTPVLTVDAQSGTGVYKTMGDIKPGDVVFRPNGRETMVTFATDVMVGRPCYAVTFRFHRMPSWKDEVIVADADHLWLTEVDGEDRRIRTTAEIAQLTHRRRVEVVGAGHREDVASCVPVPSVPVRCIQVDAEDGLFLVGRSLIPTHNSALSAAIGIYMCCCDDEGAEVIVAAGDRSQAALLHTAAKQFVESCPALSKRCKIYRNSIVFPEKNATMICISSEAGTKHGYNPSCVLVDEYHVFPDRELVDVLETGTGSRSQPLTIYITTAGTDMNGPCYKDWQRAEKIRDGVLKDDTFLPCIYAAPPEADPFSEETWRVANPNYGITLKPSYFEQFAERAKQSASDEIVFRTLHLNQWQSSDQSKWLRHGVWDANAEPLRPTAGRPCWCGVDLASTFDTTAFVAVWPDEDGTYDVQAMFFIPEENALKRSKEDRVPYQAWAKDGFVKLTDGDVTCYDTVRDYILSFCERNVVRGIAIDRWNAVHLTTQLTAEGIDVKPFGQGFASMSAPAKLLETLIVSKRLRHAGNPVLTWQMSNVQIKVDDAGNIKPTKKNSHSTARIDGAVSLIMALGIASSEPHGPTDEPTLMVL